ncbi:MAG: hypothetical protein ACR2NZ_06085 [Rubripirellula sp.]
MSLSLLEPRYWMHWDPTAKPCLDEASLTTSHRLRECSLFTDDGLAALLSRHPRQDTRLTTMGHDLSHPTEIQYGEIGSASGRELLDLVRHGRLCLQLHNLCSRRDAIATLTRNLGREFDECFGSQAQESGAFLEISSPQSLHYLHTECDHQVNWQIRGERTQKTYPATQPLVSSNTLDSIASGSHDHPLYYEPAFERHAQQVKQSAGWLSTTPALTPSLTVNSNELTVVLTTMHSTPRSTRLVHIHRANHFIRRFMPVRSPDRTLAACRWLKRCLGRRIAPQTQQLPPITFQVNSRNSLASNTKPFDRNGESGGIARVPIDTNPSLASIPAKV